MATVESIDVTSAQEVIERIRESMAQVIEGKPKVIEMALVVLLAEGHLLLEDVPGVGKTMLAKALGRSIDCSVHRIQFTPDLLPSDITGVSIYDQRTGTFEFKPGGVFANIVLGDEINRASPKTQSAMLESMEELQVSADGRTYALDRPFMVVATQNPIEMEGTYALPEAQRDRFMAKVAMGYPSEAAEVALLGTHGVRDQLALVQPVADADTVISLIETAREIYVAEAVKEYIVRLVGATRGNPQIKLGASPRATLHLLKAARAAALIAGRDYVVPDDVRTLAPQILGHRVIISAEAQMARHSVDDVLQAALDAVWIPGERQG